MFVVLIGSLPLWPNPTKVNHMEWIGTSRRPFCWSSTPNPPARKMAVKPCTKRKRKMWWCPILHEVQFVVIVPLRNNGHTNLVLAYFTFILYTLSGIWTALRDKYSLGTYSLAVTAHWDSLCIGHMKYSQAGLNTLTPYLSCQLCNRCHLSNSHQHSRTPVLLKAT